MCAVNFVNSLPPDGQRYIYKIDSSAGVSKTYTNVHDSSAILGLSV